MKYLTAIGIFLVSIPVLIVFAFVTMIELCILFADHIINRR